MDNPSRPLFNRNVLGGGPPGSTMKPLIGLAGLDSGLRRPEDRILSTGAFHIPGRAAARRFDAHGGTAGPTCASRSRSRSTPTTTSSRSTWASSASTSTCAATASARRPASTWSAKPAASCRRRNGSASARKEAWYPGETVNAGIGQGYWMATLLQLARGTARDRQRRRPAPPAPGRATPRRLSTRRGCRCRSRAPARISDNAGNLRAVREGMVATMHGPAAPRAAIGPRRAVPDGGQDRHRAGGQPQGQRAASIRTTCRCTCATRRCSSATRRRKTRRIAVAVAVEHGGFGAQHRGAGRAQDHRCLAAGQDAEPKRTDRRTRAIARRPAAARHRVATAPPARCHASTRRRCRRTARAGAVAAPRASRRQAAAHAGPERDERDPALAVRPAAALHRTVDLPLLGALLA